MERRHFLSSLVAASMASTISLQSSNNNEITIKPSRLNQGDKVSIIAPSTSVSDPDEIAKAYEFISSLGLIAQTAKNLRNPFGYKTKSIESRIEDLHESFADETVKAVFCIRGGYGSAALIDSINYDLIKNNPKIFLGYSDITALHLAISKMTGLLTFHGPVLLSKMTLLTANNLKAMLFGYSAPYRIQNPLELNGLREQYPIRIINEGQSSGKLIGGNLSLICSLLGTKYEINSGGKLLFLEDVGEEPYRIDRMLNQLRLAGKLKDLAGIIFGLCTDCNQKSFIWDSSLGEVLDNYFKPLNIPAIYGLLIGHTDNQFTIPMGINATLDTSQKSLWLTENAVV